MVASAVGLAAAEVDSGAAGEAELLAGEEHADAASATTAAPAMRTGLERRYLMVATLGLTDIAWMAVPSRRCRRFATRAQQAWRAPSPPSRRMVENSPGRRPQIFVSSPEYSMCSTALPSSMNGR